MNDHYYTIPTLEEKDVLRFWSRVDKNGPIPSHKPELGRCWQWQGPLHPYGRFKVKGVQVSTNRIAYVLKHGYDSLIDPDGGNLQACHHCDNPGCVNTGDENIGILSHLFAGTAQENKKDAIRKERIARKLKPNKQLWGEKHHNVIVTDEQVEEIKFIYRNGGGSQTAIAKQFGISQSYVGKIIHGQTRMRKTDELIPEGSTEEYYINYRKKYNY